MALRRQGLSQRRKAVGLTQEALAQRLGVERSTVVRWEAGDTEPLPSIRPHVAHALHVSLDQLAELLTEYENADTTRALPVGTDMTIPLVLPKVRPSRDECESLVPPHVAEAFEALRRTLRSAGVSPENLDAPLFIDKTSRVPLVGAELAPALSGPPADPGHPAGIGPDVPQPAQTEVPHRPSLITIPLDVEAADVQWRRARSRRFKRLTAAGILAVVFVGGAASVPFMTSHSGPIPPAGAGNPVLPAPAVLIPAPYAGSGTDKSPHHEESTGTVHSAPADVLDKPAGNPAPPAAAAVPAPRTIRASSPKRITSRPQSPASTTTPAAPRAPAIPAEAYAWSERAAASAGDHHKARLLPGSPPRRW